MEFFTKNYIDENKSIKLEFVDGPFDTLDGNGFTPTDKYNTKVSLEINYKFKSKLIEVSIEPIFTTIMNSIQNHLCRRFKIKYND